MIQKRTNVWASPVTVSASNKDGTSERGSSFLDEHTESDHTTLLVDETQPHSPSQETRKDAKRDTNKYGTFQEAQRKAQQASVKNKLGARLFNERDVNVKFFNSRGRCGDSFSAVELQQHELKSPIIQHHGHLPEQHDRFSHDAKADRPSRPKSLDDMTTEEKRLWDELSRSRSTPSSGSCYELNLNWHFIEVVGRDEHNGRKAYDKVLKQLTTDFDICPSFLVDREHTLVLPQILESPDHKGQFLICLRVATAKISTTDDSIIELTNRWLIVVDLNKKLVIVLHRIDTQSMANLRLHWNSIMQSNDISFEEFLLKLLDDAVDTFSSSLDSHASLLDICEAKLLLTSKSAAKGEDNVVGSQLSSPLKDPHCALNKETAQQVMDHFDYSSKSVFLDQLLDSRRRTIDKSEMNSFLYHLHRRSSVQHRVLITTQQVLATCFTKLRLCSKEHSAQMCSFCIELAAKAGEIRDDAQHLLDMHISLQSFRTNELMAVLTRLSVFFTPCAFLAGVYGMNFPNIPEIHWGYGYVFFWGVCVVMAGLVQFYFYKRGLF